MPAAEDQLIQAMVAGRTQQTLNSAREPRYIGRNSQGNPTSISRDSRVRYAWQQVPLLPFAFIARLLLILPALLFITPPRNRSGHRPLSPVQMTSPEEYGPRRVSCANLFRPVPAIHHHILRVTTSLLVITMPILQRNLATMASLSLRSACPLLLPFWMVDFQTAPARTYPPSPRTPTLVS